MKKLAALALSGLIVTLFVIVTAAASSPDPLQAVKAATAKYHSFAQAQAAGYTIAEEPCVAAPGLGAMGIHAINPELIADPAIDPMQPEILLYLPKANGQLELIGVEYFKVDADQNLATDADRPSVLGQPFDGPMPGHNPTMPIHYDVHLWFWADNSAGFFAPFNPNLSCPS
jgi:hypothetical protein